MKIFLDSVGCRLNQSEIEKFASQFRAAGHTIVSSAAEADYIVVNTCAVTAQAASDSRQKIRQAARAAGARIDTARETPGEVVVTGCWATLDASGARSLPGVTRVVDNLSKDHLVGDLLNLPEEAFDLEPVVREPLPGLHLRTRAFIKVQDGCDNHCTFCVTRIARGQGRSRPLADVLRDVRSALKGGTQEIVLTGVHLGSWGQDFEQPARIHDLVDGLLRQTDTPRLRLSSLEPWDLDEEFFALWSDSRLCRHLHLPLQSGSAETLRRMARKTTPESFARLVSAARAASPEIAITTDVIAGFPGETDDAFQESLDFVRQIDFAAGHVFTFSARPGTAAARMPNPLPLEVRKQRNAELRAVLAASSLKYRSRFVGAEMSVLWEATDSLGPDGWHLHGLTDNYLRVTAVAQERMWNRLSCVRLMKIDENGLLGEISS